MSSSNKSYQNCECSFGLKYKLQLRFSASKVIQYICKVTHHFIQIYLYIVKRFSNVNSCLTKMYNQTQIDVIAQAQPGVACPDYCQAAFPPHCGQHSANRAEQRSYFKQTGWYG